MANRGRAGFDQDSVFAILEHADEGGRVAVEGLPAAASNSKPAPAKSRPGQQQAPKKQAPQKQTAGRPASAQPQTSRAEDYYRAFEHVFRDPSSGVDEVVLRFHKTKIVRIRPNGDMMLTSGGWPTATTVAALNDALTALGMKLTYQAPVSAGLWTVTDDTGTQYPFTDGVVIKAKTAEHRNRQVRLLKAYNGGAEVPRYARKPAPAGTAGRPTQPGQSAAAAAGGPAGQVRAGAAQHHAAPQQHHAGPKQADAAQLEQIKAAMEELTMEEEDFIADEHLCVVCLDNARDEVLVPCGHMVLCQGCCADIMASTNECPMCREKIQDHCTIDPDDA